MIDRKKVDPNSRVSARGKPEGRLLVPDDAIIRIELEVEERVRQSITQLVTSSEWADILRRRLRPRLFDTDTRQQRSELLLIVERFARKYKWLLENAVVEYCREIGQACRGSGLPSASMDQEDAWQRGCQFAERFTMGEYEEPWVGSFMLKPSPTSDPTLRDDEPDEEAITGEFQEAGVLARLFDDAACSVKVAAEAEGFTGPQYVWREFAWHVDGWKKDSASRAKNQFLIVTTGLLKAGAASAPDFSPAKAKAEDHRPNQAPKSWQEIEIAFLSDERVQIFCGATTLGTYNYGELGFEDRRNETANRAWKMLREMANHGGTIPRPSAGKDRAMVQKRIEEIRKRLRGQFKITTDPIPFNGDVYQTSFKIACRRCSDT